MKKVYLLLLFFFSIFSLSAQCLTKEIALEKRIKAVEYIVEGRVIAKQSFWDDHYHNIYTSNTIFLYRVFKGQIENAQTIELITRGGRVGQEMQIDHPSLLLNIGDTGIFLLHDNTVKNQKNARSNTLYCTSKYINQGYLNYAFKAGKIIDGHYVYDDITVLYELIEQNIQQKSYSVAPFRFDKIAESAYHSNAKNITSFSPSIISAGTESILTITGNNFGTIQGSIEFANADNGGATINIAALSEQIKTWSNTEITVEVPSGASTGNFEVITTSNGTFTSSSPLTVSYNQSNAQNGGDAYPTQFVDDNGLNGITFQFFTDFADGTDLVGADQAFLSAMNTWCVATGVNWIRGADSNVDAIASDGVNIVRFGSIGGSTIGRATSRWSACGSGGVFADWYVTELDIVFNENNDWFAGAGTPSNSQSDFESVALHELGHAHQLGHTSNGTNNSGDVMYFQILDGAIKRTLSSNDEAGADDVFDRSSNSSICGRGLMTVSNCGTLPVELLHFNGSWLNEQILLTWETASEINNAGFEVQRSRDAKEWESLVFVKGYGTTLEAQRYKYYDQQPKSGINYYRLKQIDTDETFEYSKLISINQKRIKEEKLTIFPNPASANIQIEFLSNHKDSYEFQLLDAFGRVLRTWSTTTATQNLSLEGLPNGSYLIVAKGNRSHFSCRFVKQ